MGLLPLNIKSINCYGKFIWWEFYNDNGEIEYTLWNTLGMTGYWSTELTAHSHLKLSSHNKDLYFCDVRKFGNHLITLDPFLNS